MALHTLFDYVEEEDEHPSTKFKGDDAYWALPQFPNDDKYEEAREACLEDFDVLELFEDDDDESSSEGAEDVDLPGTKPKLEFMQSDIGQRVFNYAYMHPKEWFEALYADQF